MDFKDDLLEDELKDLEKFEKNDDAEFLVKKKSKKNYQFEPNELLYRIKLTYNNYSKVYKTKIQNLAKDSLVIIPTQYGSEIGIVQGVITNMDEIMSQEEILSVVRIATDEDKAKYENNLKKEKNAFEITVKKIKEHGLDMKLINVHYFLEDSKVLFNFTSDGRIDFRDLVKDLASIFKTRIELRQIGVRDECRIMSGYGQCGRPFCCSNVVNDLEPITIKMAKEQNLTLNSLKISGTCGRLLCCLSYEYKTYQEEKKKFPDIGTKIKINNEVYVVNEVNVQSKNIKLYEEKEGRFIYITLNNLKYDSWKSGWTYVEK